jgi:hypothetical protein
MSVKLNPYDFFAYTIPGGVVLFTILYSLDSFGIYDVDFQGMIASAGWLLLLAGVAYLTGLLIKPFSDFWYHLFRPKGFPEKALEEFKKIHPSIKISFQGEDWTILLAYIRHDNPDIASEIERVNASSVMMRSISLGLMLLAIVEIVHFALALVPLQLVFGICLVVFSIIAGRQSDRFSQWFFFAIYESIASHSEQVTELVKSNPDAKKPGKSQK